MSKFTVPIVRIRAIEPISNADMIELAVVGEYRSVIQKGRFTAGDLAVYLPEAAVLPESIIARLGLTGKLAGPDRNRVTAVRLRGCLSQGILDDALPPGAAEGADVADMLGVTKWEPPIPESMSGTVMPVFGATLKYDVENYKAFPDVLAEGELVEMVEKAHGTFCAFALVPGLDQEAFGGNGLVYSKGLGATGLSFADVPGNDRNVYVSAARSLDAHARIRTAYPGRTVHVLGEVFGPGVQDLHYGRTGRVFAAFDVWMDGAYLSRDDLTASLARLDFDRMPVLYRGPFNKTMLDAHTNGKTVLGGGAHIREGVVVTPVVERTDPQIGRVILKSVSGDYLLRKGNTTEFT